MYRRPFGPQDVTSAGPALFCACKISNFQCLRLEKTVLSFSKDRRAHPAAIRVQGLGFHGFGFRVWDFRVQGLGFHGVLFRVQGLGFRV